MSESRRRWAFESIVTTFAGIGYAYAVCAGGLPALRHDWWWTATRNWADALVFVSGGWIAHGIGYPNPYPTNYLVGGAGALLSAVVPEFVLLTIYAFAIGATIAFGARALAIRLGAGTTIRSAASVFAVFNPMVYAKTVAGHLEFLLAYGVAFWVAAELLRRAPRPVVLALLVALTLQQIQIFIIVSTVLAAYTVKTRRRLPLLSALIVAAPISYGIVREGRYLADIPFLWSWELNQSVRPLKAITLDGYFAAYTGAFAQVSVALYAVVALAIIGVALVRPRAALLIPAIVTVTAAFFAMGLRGPFAPILAWAIEHVRATAVFRELYDFEAFVALGYVMLATAAAVRFRPLSAVYLASALVLVVPWVRLPPAEFWVDARALPSVRIVAVTNSRYALLPAFQPFVFAGRGSGRDPDAVQRAGNVTPLNAFAPTYPVDAALAELERCDDRLASVLGVSTVVDRPWLDTDLRRRTAAVRSEGGPHRRFCKGAYRSTAAPELAYFAGEPASSKFPTDDGANAVFFGDDSAHRGSLHVLTTRPISSDATTDWIDARLTFDTFPQGAQELGGVATSSRRNLTVAGSGALLVAVRGRLDDRESGLRIDSTRGLRWIDTRSGDLNLRCTGFCVVVARCTRLGHVALAAPERRDGRSLAFDASAPWFAVTTVAPGPAGTIRFLTAFDANWIAFDGRRLLRHFKVDAAVNGWDVPARTAATRIVLVQTTALVQTILELVAVAWVAALSLGASVRMARRNPSSTSKAMAKAVDAM